MWQELARAVCLMLIIEGILPFLYPDRWRQLVESLATTTDRSLRIMGFVSMMLGLVLLLVLS